MGVQVAKGKSAGTAKRTSRRLTGAARRVKDKTVQAAADHPLIAEIVAATMVAAAAALKNPAKARQLAESAADEITAAAKDAGAKGGALWALALDIARRSMDSFADAGAPAARAPKASKGGKAAKPAKASKKPAKKKKKKAA